MQLKATLLKLRTGDKTKAMPAVLWDAHSAGPHSHPGFAEYESQGVQLTWIVVPGWQARPVELGAMELSAIMNKLCCTLTKYTNSMALVLLIDRQQILPLSSSALVSHIQMKSLKSFLLEVQCQTLSFLGWKENLGTKEVHRNVFVSLCLL